MTWNDIIQGYLATPEGKLLKEQFTRAKAVATISPIPELVFRSYAETICPFENLKIIIVGTEPNADPALADGLCLSCKKPDFMLPETREMYNWMKRSIFPLMPVETFKNTVACHSMVDLSRQGILMTNEILSTYSGRPNSHTEIGWQHFTRYMISRAMEIKAEENKPIMLIGLGLNRKLRPENMWEGHMYVNISDPKNGLKFDDLDNTTKQVFVVMSTFVAENYPEQAKSYHLSLDALIDWSKMDNTWLEFVVTNNIPMPAIPEGISKRVREAILKFADKFELNGVMQTVNAPSLTFKVGINYLLNTLKYERESKGL